jgi:hypothetical protein
MNIVANKKQTYVLDPPRIDVEQEQAIIIHIWVQT